MKDYKVKKIDIIIILLITFVFSIFAIAVNSIFFSEKKVSKIYNQSGENTVIYPGTDECIQGFYVPYKTYGFYIDMFINDQKEEHDEINILLLDNQYNVIKTWEISEADILSNDKIYLSLEDYDLVIGDNYYLVAFSEQESSIGIVCVPNSNIGYLSQENNGYVWSYSIVYEAFSPMVVVIEILVLFFIIILFLLYRMNVSDWKIFTILYTVLTIGFFIVMPFNTAFDEAGHFTRSYEVSRGRLLSYHDDKGAGKSLIPTDAAYLMQYSTYERDNFKYKYDQNAQGIRVSEDESYVANPNQSLYSPASYIPQAIGIRIFDIFTDSLYWIYFGGRLFAAIFNMLLVVLAVYLSKDYLKIIMLIVCTPVFITSMISYSADGTLNSLTLFFVAYVLHCKNKEKVTRSDKTILLVGSVMLALSKVIYFPLAFMVWIVSDKALSEKHKVYKAVVSIVSIFAFLIWFIIAKSYLFVEYGVEPNSQMKYVLTHIPSFIIISLKTILVSALPWLKSLFGAYLYDSQVELNDLVWLGFGIMTLMAFVSYRRNGDSYKLEKKSDRYIILGILLLIMGLTFASLYVQWTPYKNPVIEGIQGRYFIPLLYPLAVAISKKNEENKSVFPIMTAIILLNLIAGINMYQAYV